MFRSRLVQLPQALVASVYGLTLLPHQCEHHDLRLLEAAYQQEQEQATAQPWSTPDATITTDLDISTLSDITISGPSPQDLMDQTCPSTADSLLIGIHDTPSSANIPSTQHFNSDISQILEDVSLTTNPGLAFQPSSSTGIDTTFPPASRELQIAIGRVRQDGMWECQHSLKTGCQPASPGIWASGGIWAAHLCGTAFLDHCDLLAHFRSHHFNVEEASPPFVNKCQRCGCLKDIRPSCPGCSGEVFDLWYFGTRAEHSNNQSQSRRALWIPSTGVGAGFGSGSFGSGSGSAGHGFPSSFSGAYGTGEYGAGTDGSSTSAYGGYLYSPHCHSTETTTTLPRNISSGQTGKLDMGLKQSLYQPTTKLPSWKHLRWVANHIVSKYLCLFIASIILVISDRVGVLPLLGTCLGANSLRVAIAWATSASCCIAVVGAVAILISSVLGIETSFPALEEVYRGAVVDIG